MGVLQDLGVWLWRLLPGNPILLRVVGSGGKRVRHLWARVIYLVVLFALMLILGANALGTERSLAELAKNATRTFYGVSIAQLFLMSFIAPVFAAGAITQEKDANTFHILLTTPLSSAQIVLGMLFSRLFFVWALLLSGLPIFCITMLYGGVTWLEVRDSLLLAACTGLVTGSLAISLGVIRVGTRKTIFSFFAGVAVYLIALGAYGISAFGWLPEAELGADQPWRMSWVAPLHPFLALNVVTGATPAPPLYKLEHYGWPWSWMLARPQYAYILLTTAASAVMIGLCLFFVRRSSKEGEVGMLGRMRAAVMRGESGERRKKPRHVWSNPIAWREAATRGSAGGRSAMRWAYLVGGVVAGIGLLIAHEQSRWGLSPARPEIVRTWLTVLIWIELAVVLLIVTNTAATTLTREKESQTIEMLLTTPLTSRYIIEGMGRGLVSFVLPLLIAPTATILVFSIADLFRGDAAPIPGAATRSLAVTTIEATVLAPMLMVAFCSLAAMIGLHFSLQAKKTVQAVMISSGVVLGASGLLWGCGAALLSQGSSNVIAAAMLPFMPFPAIQAIIHHATTFSSVAGTTPPAPEDLAAARVIRIFSSLISIGVYAAVTYSIYTHLVRNFDMTVRRQSA